MPVLRTEIYQKLSWIKHKNLLAFWLPKFTDWDMFTISMNNFWAKPGSPMKNVGYLHDRYLFKNIQKKLDKTKHILPDTRIP